MSQTLNQQEQQRNLVFLTDPNRWTLWPFLPLVRCTREDSDDFECGLLCDLERLLDLSGYRCTVLLCNLFCLPQTLEELLTLPKETFDTFEELLAAGWRIDGPDTGIIVIEVSL